MHPSTATEVILPINFWGSQLSQFLLWWMPGFLFDSQDPLSLLPLLPLSNINGLCKSGANCLTAGPRSREELAYGRDSSKLFRSDRGEETNGLWHTVRTVCGTLIFLLPGDFFSPLKKLTCINIHLWWLPVKTKGLIYFVSTIMNLTNDGEQSRVSGKIASTASFSHISWSRGEAVWQEGINHKAWNLKWKMASFRTQCN